MQSCFRHAAPKSLRILLPTRLLRVSFIAASQPSGVGTMSFTWRAENCLHFYPLAHQARCHSQWLMDVKVLKSNSCSSGCYLTPQHPHRIGLRLGVQLKSLLLDFFFFPLLLPQVPYWLVLGVLPLINHLDPNAWIRIYLQETNLNPGHRATREAGAHQRAPGLHRYAQAPGQLHTRRAVLPVGIQSSETMDFTRLHSVDLESTISGFSLMICCSLSKAMDFVQPWDTEEAPTMTETEFLMILNYGP